MAYVWLPPQSQVIRGLLVCGQLGIELEMALDSQVRQVCVDNDIAIVYFVPHISAVFHYWQAEDASTQRFLKALDDLARRTGQDELRRVPWITMGHSTAGIFCRNVAYWKPSRTAGIIHIKSGNYHQKEHLPPSGSLAGIPVLNINGQFEVFGPEGGIRPELGRQTQWMCVRNDIQKFEKADPDHLMSLLLDLGGDHFHGSPELAGLAALFIAKTAQYRIPKTLNSGGDQIACIPLNSKDGWLTDANLYEPAAEPALYKNYRGDKATAMWHYDREMALAISGHHRNLGLHQAISVPAFTWLDDGDGWTFKVKAGFLDKMPVEYGGNVGGIAISHADGPISYRCKATEPVTHIGPDTFRVLRPIQEVHIAAVHPGDGYYRATSRWGKLRLPQVKSEQQTITFPPIPDVRISRTPVMLLSQASSRLPIHYEVDYGPINIHEGKLTVSDLPCNSQFPMECKVTAYQMGRRMEPCVCPVEPVSRTFQLLGP